MSASKLAVVTGGMGGIGKAICERLAASGHRLIIVDMEKRSNNKNVEIASKASNWTVDMNVTEAEDVEKLRSFLQTNFIDESPSVLVNCAGITRDSTLLKMSLDQWNKVNDVNLKGVFLMSQMVAQEAVRRKTKLSIVNVSSIVGKIGNFGQTNYAATKAGVIGFTKSAARELASKNIRVNSVLPGFIRTPMTEAMPEKVLEGMVSLVPQKRLGEPGEIADAVLFFASDQSSYITGTTLEVTGGLGM